MPGKSGLVTAKKKKKRKKDIAKRKVMNAGKKRQGWRMRYRGAGAVGTLLTVQRCRIGRGCNEEALSEQRPCETGHRVLLYYKWLALAANDTDFHLE